MSSLIPATSGSPVVHTFEEHNLVLPSGSNLWAQIGKTVKLDVGQMYTIGGFVKLADLLVDNPLNFRLDEDGNMRMQSQVYVGGYLGWLSGVTSQMSGVVGEASQSPQRNWPFYTPVPIKVWLAPTADLTQEVVVEYARVSMMVF